MVASTVGSSTSTFWKRRSSAASFSMYLRYSSSVVAPTQCSSPRASAGLSMLPASIAPSALPAPTMVCSSSMKTMVWPSSLASSLSTAFRRSSNSPRYLAPASSARHVERQHALVLERLGHLAVDDALREALDDRGLADAGLADQHRVVLGAPLQDLDRAADLVVAADHRVELALRARARSGRCVYFVERLALAFGLVRCRRSAPPRTASIAVSSALRVSAVLLAQRGRSSPLSSASGEQEQLAGDELVAALLRFLVGDVEQLRQVARDVHLAAACPRPSAASRSVAPGLS